MKNILKFYVILIAAILCLDTLLPHDTAFAYLHSGTPVSLNPNACGISTNNWCVGSDGWTVFTASQGTGTCGTSPLDAGSCLIAADNSTAASFNGTITGTSLAINSGTPPTAGQSLLVAGAVVATILSGTGPFTLSGSPGNQTSNMTSSAGNDTTCALQAPPSNPFTSAMLSTFVPTSPCFSQSTAAGKMRSINPKTYTATITATISGTLMQVTAQSGSPVQVGAAVTGGTATTGTLVVNQVSGSVGGTGFYTVSISQSSSPTQAQLSTITSTNDWFLTKKGTVWNGVIGGGNFNRNGYSTVELMVIATYGSGARPKFLSIDGTNSQCFEVQAARGYNMALVGYWCYNQLADPSSPNYLGFTITADAGTSAASPCATAATICNTAVPAAVQANPTRYRATATGIYYIAVTAATSTTITLASNAGNPTTVATGQMNIQLTNTTTAGGFGWNEYSTLIVEDNRIDFGSVGILANTNVFDLPNVRFRRNMLVNDYTPPFGGDNIFSGDAVVANVSVFEENAMSFGGWNPQVWAGGGWTGSHSMYLHDPSPPVNLYSNIVAHNPADNQYRDGGTAYNNLFLYNGSGGGMLATNIEDNQTTLSYNVNQKGGDVPIGVRTAGVTECSGTGSGCSVLHLDGALASGSAQLIGGTVDNTTNPNSISTTATPCTISSVHDAVSVNLSCTLAVGNRGNGVQAGDVLLVHTESSGGLIVQSSGQVISKQYNVNSQYPAYASVSVSAASPSVVTDPSTRSAGEPFSFTPVILTVGGSGYGASVSGTLTWNGSGCSVNPVINVSTNAAGTIVAFTGIATPATCGTPPSATAASWTAGGGLSAGSGASVYYNTSMGTLPTGVSLASATGGACTGSLVANPNTGLTVCTYYALSNGTSYQFSATSGGVAINASGSAGTSISRTGTALIYLGTNFAPIYPTGAPSGVTAGMFACVYQSGRTYFNGPNGYGCTTVQSLSPDRNTVIFNDASVFLFNAIDPTGSPQATVLFGLPAPCSIYPGCHTATVGPNNIFSNFIGTGGIATITFEDLSSGYNGANNYIFNWHASAADNLLDNGFAGTNTLIGAQVLNANTGYSNIVGANSLQANIEYYDATQIETGNTFSGYIDNGSGSAGYILTITSGSPSLVFPTNANGGYGDTIFDTTTNTNVLAQYTQITAQIDSTHYLVSVSQKVGSSGSPQAMMYGSVDRFLAKATAQSKDAGWIAAYTAEAANDFIRAKLGCGNQSVFSGSPACPTQGQTIH